MPKMRYISSEQGHSLVTRFHSHAPRPAIRWALARPLSLSRRALPRVSRAWVISLKSRASWPSSSSDSSGRRTSRFPEATCVVPAWSASTGRVILRASQVDKRPAINNARAPPPIVAQPKARIDRKASSWPTFTTRQSSRSANQRYEAMVATPRKSGPIVLVLVPARQLSMFGV